MGWCLLSTLCTWQWEEKGLLGLGMLQSQTAPIAVPSFLSVLTHLFLWGSVFSCSCTWCNWTPCPVWGKVPEFCLRNFVCDTSLYDGLCLGITRGNDVNSCNKMFCGLCHHASERYSTGCLLTAKEDLPVKYSAFGHFYTWQNWMFDINSCLSQSGCDDSW